MLRYIVVYRDLKEADQLGLYCDTARCRATTQRAGARHCACYTALARDLAPTTRPLWPATRPAPWHDTVGDPATIRRPCARLGASAHLGVPVGRVLVLVHLAWFLTWFFDSVVFMSHRLDPVHEHCSSQKFLENFFN